MADFSHLNIQEASTVTAKAATVTMTRNSSVMHQEIISLGDPESSLSIARVSSAAPASTDAGLIVRQVGHSTIVTVAAMPAGSTSVTVAAIAGPVSTAAPTTSDTGLIVRQVGYSTVVSVANTVTIAGNSTAVIPASQLSSAAAPANSSIAQVVRIAGGPSSAADVAITIHGNQSSNSSIYLPVRLTNGTAFLAATQDFVHGSTVSTVAADLHAPGIMLRGGSDALSNTNTFTMLRGSTAGSALVSLVTDSGASVMDSTATAVKVHVVAGAVAGPTSTAAPATNDTGLIVRQVGYSTIVTVAAMPANSSVVAIASFPAGMISSAAPAANDTGLLVRVIGHSTIVTVAALPANSSQVEVRAMPANSSVVALGSIAAGLISSAAPAHGSSALLVRQVVSSLQSTTVTITSSNSTVVLTVLSSQTGNQRVYAYFIGASTSGNHSTILLGNSTAPSLWGVVMSSGVWGANLAVDPKGFLFETGAGNPLTARIESASTAITARISLSFKVD